MSKKRVCPKNKSLFSYRQSHFPVLKASDVSISLLRALTDWWQSSDIDLRCWFTTLWILTASLNNVMDYLPVFWESEDDRQSDWDEDDCLALLPCPFVVSLKQCSSFFRLFTLFWPDRMSCSLSVCILIVFLPLWFRSQSSLSVPVFWTIVFITPLSLLTPTAPDLNQPFLERQSVC